MKAYSIRKITSPSPNWSEIASLSIDTFPWYESGLQQATEVQLACNEDSLFIRISAEDKHSFARQTELNHMLVCEDSCVEFFFSPSGELGGSYINLEVNCCGTLHLAYGPNRHARTFLPLELAALISRDCSIKSPVKIESDEDTSWNVEIALPFAVIDAFTTEKRNPNKWFANFYRCGGRHQPQYAVWNNIESTEPDYHRPECFGELTFE